MRFTTLSLSLLTLLGPSLSAALPTDLSEFYIVTTDQSDPSSNSSQLRGVSATTPYAEDPISQSSLLLRLIASGYNSLPNFTLADGTLSTVTTGPHGIGTYKYNSTTLQANTTLQFLPSQQTSGNIALDQGYLLTVGGEKEGWTICKSQTGQQVIYWKGADTSCKKTYLQAVGTPPYKRKRGVGVV